MHTAYLSLGSNVGDRENNLREAVARLHETGQVIRVSSYYETRPMEVTEQPWFLNCALELQTPLTPVVLLQTLLKIERAMGRERTQAKGPRNIDLDLLLFDDETLHTSELSLPHPAMHARRFVLVPLAEIAPLVMHPVLRKTVSELLANLPDDDDVRKMNQQQK
jgi:2-amino-4-hydroxy-6-hydroxymethyldihydropteridine diphosphokinase